MGINDGASRSNGPNDSQIWSRFGTNGYSNQQTIACPPGYFAYGLAGKSGADVNQLSGLHCRNIITGASQDVNGGPIGSSTGGNGGSLSASGNDGMTGFMIRAETELEGIKPIYRGSNNKNCCGSGTYNDGSRMGNNNLSGPYTCDTPYLVQSISGGTSQHDAYATNFSWTCRNFSNMASIGANPLNCCMGTDTSQDCADVKQYLGCPAVVQNYCSQGTNIFTDSQCLAGAAAAIPGLDAVTVANLKLSTCAAGNNYSMDVCSDFCTAKTGLDIAITNTTTDALTHGNNIKDGCNMLYATKCAANSSAAVCGCQRPWNDPSYTGSAQIPDNAEFVKDPACYFAVCRNFGYFAKPLSEHGCPTCVQYQQLNVTGSDIALQNIQQNCTTSGITPTPLAATTTAPATATTTTPSSSPVAAQVTMISSVKNNGMLWLVACALLSLLVLAFLAFIALM